MRIPKPYMPEAPRQDGKPMPQTATDWIGGKPYMTLVDERGDCLACFMSDKGYSKGAKCNLSFAGYATDWAVWDETGAFVRLKEEEID